MPRILRWLTLFFAIVVIPILALFAAAPHSVAARRAAVALVGPVRQVVTFGRTVGSRHPGCTVGEAWRRAAAAQQPDPNTYSIVRQDGNLQLVRTTAGEFWSPKRDFLTVLEMAEEQGLDIYGGPNAAVRTGDVVLDVGANIGMFTRHALARGASKVVAIEPNPELVECLRRNFAAEIAAGSVVVYPKGLWHQDAELTLTSADELASTANSVAINRGAPGVVVPLTTMDRMIGELGLDRVSFLKMDIEGAEAKALEGGRQTIRRYRPRMAIAMEHFLTDHTVIPALLRDIDAGLSFGFSGTCVAVEGRLVPQVLFAQ